MTRATILRREDLEQLHPIQALEQETRNRCRVVEQALNDTIVKEAQQQIAQAHSEAAAMRDKILTSCKAEMLEIILEVLDTVFGTYSNVELAQSALEAAVDRHEVGGDMRLHCSSDLLKQMQSIAATMPTPVQVSVDQSMRPGQAVLYGRTGRVDLGRDALIGTAQKHLQELQDALQ